MSDLTPEVKDEIRNFIKAEGKDAAELRERRLQTAIALISVFGIFVLTTAGAGLYFLFQQIASNAAQAAVEQRLTQSEIVDRQTEALNAVVTARTETQAAELRARELNLRGEELLAQLRAFNVEFQEAQTNLKLAKTATDLGQGIRNLATDPDFLASVRGNIVPTPKGMIAAFTTTASVDDVANHCPDGWTPFVEARGRFIVGAGPSGGSLSSYEPLSKGGEEMVKLEESNIPAHDHNIFADSAATGRDYPTVNQPVAISASVQAAGLHNENFEYQIRPGTGTPSRGITSKSGDNKPHENMPPFIALYYCVKD